MINEIKDLLSNREYIKAKALVQKELDKHPSYELYYLYFLSDNGNYIDFDYLNINNTYAFNKACEDENKDFYNLELNVYSALNKIENFNTIFRYIYLENYDKALELLKNINNASYEIFLNNSIYSDLEKIILIDKTNIKKISYYCNLIHFLYFKIRDEKLLDLYYKLQLFLIKNIKNESFEDVVKETCEIANNGYKEYVSILAYNDMLLKKDQVIKELNDKYNKLFIEMNDKTKHKIENSDEPSQLKKIENKFKDIVNNLSKKDSYLTVEEGREKGKSYYFSSQKNKYEKALQYFEYAARKGDMESQFNLGVMYEYGEGVEVNYKKAIEWYEKAAKQGYAKAQCNLGVIYASGKGVEKNYDLAITWYEKAALKGNSTAQYNLAELYEYGQGVEANKQEAIYWYEKAAKNGDIDAKTKLRKLKD